MLKSKFSFFFFLVEDGFYYFKYLVEDFSQDFTLNILFCKVHTVIQSIHYIPKRCDLWEKHFLHH